MGNVDEGITKPTDPVRILINAMYIQSKHVKTVLQDFTAVADVQQMPIISRKTLMVIMKSDASSRGSVWSVQS